MMSFRLQELQINLLAEYSTGAVSGDPRVRAGSIKGPFLFSLLYAFLPVVYPCSAC